MYNNINVNVSGPVQPTSTYKTFVLKGQVSFATQVTEPNMKYVIKYNFDLGGESVTIPEGCLLEFDGGRLSNGTIVGQNTQINWNKQSVIFGNNLTIGSSGSWKLDYISTAMFVDLSADNALRNLQYLNNDDVQNTVVIEDGDYWFNVSAEVDHGFLIHSNTDFIINGTCKMRPNAFEKYGMIWARNKKNVTISGSGILIGDRDDHLGETGEWGQNLTISRCENVIVRGITSTKAWGDCINVSSGSSLPYIANSNILIENVTLSYGRRQGISVTSGYNIIIKNCNISNCGGTKPGAGIDIEPNEYDEPMYNIIIENIYVNNSRIGITCNGSRGLEGSADKNIFDVIIRNCNITETDFGIFCTNIKSATVTNCIIDNVHTRFVRSRLCGTFVLEKCICNFDAEHIPIGTFQRTNNLIIKDNVINYNYPDAIFPRLVDESEGVDIDYAATPFVNDRNGYALYEHNIVVNPQYVILNNEKDIWENTTFRKNVFIARKFDLVYQNKVFAFKDMIFLQNTIKFDFNFVYSNLEKLNLSGNITIKDNVIDFVDFNADTGSLMNIGGKDSIFDNNIFNISWEEGFSFEGKQFLNFTSSQERTQFTNNIINGNLYRFFYVNGTNNVVLRNNRINGVVAQITTTTSIFAKTTERSDGNGDKGTSTNRPILPSEITAFQYFDTTLNKPIYWNGTNWVDATGATV